MNPNEEEREYVEAVPGPAIVISKQEYERMQKGEENPFIDSSALERRLAYIMNQFNEMVASGK